MAKIEQKKITKIKKKLWYKIIAPKIFGSKEIGESYLEGPENAVGRKIKINLRDLTGNVKDQNIYIGFQINGISGRLLNTTVISYELTPSYIKRAVRKNTARLDDYFEVKTKGGKKVILKSFMVSINKAQRSVKAKLRREVGTILAEEASKVDFATFISSLVTRRIQMDLKKKLKKILPLKEVAIRVSKLKEQGLVQEEAIVKDDALAEKTEPEPPANPKEVQRAEVNEPEDLTGN